MEMNCQRYGSVFVRNRQPQPALSLQNPYWRITIRYNLYSYLYALNALNALNAYE